MEKSCTVKKSLLNFKINANKLNITVILLLLMIHNAQNEFKSLLDSKSVGLARKINGGDAWKVENGTTF
jgi:hypothetical protein